MREDAVPIPQEKPDAVEQLQLAPGWQRITDNMKATRAEMLRQNTEHERQILAQELENTDPTGREAFEY